MSGQSQEAFRCQVHTIKESHRMTREHRPGGASGMRAALLVGAAMVLLAAGAGPASAGDDFGVAGFDGHVRQAGGAAETQAGAHPESAETLIEFKAFDTPFGLDVREDVKTTAVDLPPGFVGNAQAAPQCQMRNLVDGSGCAPATQVGVIAAYLNGSPATYPIYNLDPARGTPAQFAFILLGRPNVLTAKIRPDDFGLSLTAQNVTNGVPVTSLRAAFWGTPAADSHTPLRFPRGTGACVGDLVDVGADLTTCAAGAVANVSPIPLLTNPANCAAGPLRTVLRVDSWTNPGDFKTASFISHDDDVAANPVGVTGCDRLNFQPASSIELASGQPDSPSGATVGLTFPQNGMNDAEALTAPPLKDAKVTLPDGLTVNPGSADGLQACSDDQVGFGNDSAVACPQASKIGSVIAETPVLKDALTGSVYLRTQASGDPESGEMFRLALVIEDAETGISVKLPGSVRASAQTGRLEATFANNPQVPVGRIKLQLKDGPRASLATPQSCGAGAMISDLTSWAGNSVRRTADVSTDCTPGLGGFTPGLTGGTVTATAGTFSPFSLGITKPDGNAPLDGLRLDLPSGLLAKLKGNMGQQVGTVKAFAGSGSNPLLLLGKVYLEGRYDDAPFSLRVVVPAKAGPFDLGDVTVRQKIYVDPIDAHVTVVSDPLPTIVKGVPVRLQRLDVSVDKPDFTLNPTSCAAKWIGGVLHSVAGQSAPLSVRFQVSDCASLGLKPALGLTLSGKGQTTDGKHPAVTADLVQQPGQANLKKARVALPLSLALDPDNANGLCEFADGSKATPTCPKASIVGTATATTPILDEPLSGPVYFVKNIRKDAKSGREIRTLPKLVIPLVGQNGVKLTLTGTSNVENDQLVTTFDNIPDAPVSSFKLSIIGGKGGILTVSGADICKATQIADQEIDGQNSKAADADVYIQTPSCPLKVISKKVGKTGVAVKVGGLGAGKVTVTGKGIRKTTTTISKSTVATITVRRTSGKPGRVAVSFLPKGAKKAKRTSK